VKKCFLADRYDKNLYFLSLERELFQGQADAGYTDGRNTLNESNDLPSKMPIYHLFWCYSRDKIL